MKSRAIGAILGIALFFSSETLALAPPPDQRSATAKSGMVAAANPLAVEAGLEMLAKGGNAVDAAAAAAFAITVVEPDGSSIGGDGIALVYSVTDGRVAAFNYRCQAPLKATSAIFDNSKQSQWQNTPLEPGVPGMLAGTCAMHEEYGLLPLKDVIAPAIRYAREGYTVGPTLAGIIADTYSLVSNNQEASKLYLADGFPPDPGAILKNEDLARTLETIAAEGPGAMYGGSLGQRIATYLQSCGGIISNEDFAAYKATRTEPLMIDYRGFKVYSSPPPFGGIQVLESLQILERLPLNAADGPSSAKTLHLLAGTMLLASADRTAYAGDPRFSPIPTDKLLSDAYADERAKVFNPTRALVPSDVTAGKVPETSPGGGSTTHLTVVDSQGNAVSLTQTLGGFFGCGIVVPGTGILLNDQMKNFSSRRGSPNNLQPGKRMNSTQSPTIVTKDGQLVLAIGSPGDYRIVSTMTEVLVNFMDFHMPVKDAVNAPRISARNSLGQLEMESRITPAVRDELTAMGYKLTVRKEMDLHFGGVHAVQRDPATGLLTGAADPRRDGVAGGYDAPVPAKAGKE